MKREQLELLLCHLAAVPVQNAPVGWSTTDITSVRRQEMSHKSTEVDSASEEFEPEAIANHIGRRTGPELAGVRIRANGNQDR